ncbi:hypothetical protein V2I01_41780 [Micromonospora sp. BRA006-A]|nr:hypothetical protein [Micromonospora sp. BRA006-A]
MTASARSRRDRSTRSTPPSWPTRTRPTRGCATTTRSATCPSTTCGW